MRRSATIGWLGGAATLAVAGAAVLIAAGDRPVAYGVGLGLIGLAAVAVVSLAFYAVGRSEDRDRAADDRRDVRRRPPGA
jgi:hypothetical protein